MTILKGTGFIDCLCSSGLPGEMNDEITMNITFINGNLSCSAQCNSELYQPQSPCVWTNVTWNETTGTCTGIIDTPTPSDTDHFCCVTDSANVSTTINTTVSTCKDLSLYYFANEKDSNTVAIILGFAAGVIVTLGIVFFVIAVVCIWKKYATNKRRNYIPGMLYTT